MLGFVFLIVIYIVLYALFRAVASTAWETQKSIGDETRSQASSMGERARRTFKVTRRSTLEMAQAFGYQPEHLHSFNVFDRIGLTICMWAQSAALWVADGIIRCVGLAARSAIVAVASVMLLIIGGLILIVLFGAHGSLKGMGGSGGSRGYTGLPANPGDHFVSPHLRDGQLIDGYWRTNPDATTLNNYSGPFGDHYRRLNGRD